MSAAVDSGAQSYSADDALSSLRRPAGDDPISHYQAIVKQCRSAAEVPMYRIKVISMGEAGVGKSCLIKRYCEERFVPKYLKTIGIDYGVKRYQFKTTTNPSGSVEMRVNFWDFSGAAEFLETRTEFYVDAQAALLVYDVNNHESFRALTSRWLPEASKHLTSGSKYNLVTAVCANKVDMCAQDNNLREVSEIEGRKWAEKNGFAYYETSAFNGLNVNDMFERLFRDTYDAKLA